MTSTGGAHALARTERRPLRLADLLPVRLSPGGRRSFRALRNHGTTLHAVASMLTADPDLAARLVVLAIASCSADDVDPCLRDLSTAVAIEWLGTGVHHASSRPGAEGVTGSSLLQEVSCLPDDQRALLALCRFGGHTYREAALVLGIPADLAARLLGDALRSLAAPHPLGGEQPVMVRGAA